MKQYKYTAVNLQKQKFTGTFIANDERDLAAQLAKQNLYLVSCSVYSGKTPSAFWTLGTGKVSVEELTTFCNQFSIMLSVGIPILGIMESLIEQPFSSFFHSLLNMIHEDIKGGLMLSDAINKHKKVFPTFFRSMVFVGEKSGNLEMVFKALADYYDKDTAMKRKTKSALSYPILLGCLTVAIVILMLVFVVPSFRDTLSKLNVELSGLTKAIFEISDFLLKNWLYILAGIIVVVGAILIFSKTKTGKLFFDRLKLVTPFINKLEVSIMASRFARGFSLLLNSGMNIVEALDTVVILIDNQEMVRRFKKASEEIKHGTSMSQALSKYSIFPQVMLQMINIGERTATLGNVLNDSSDYFDEQVEETLNGVTSKIQPIMLVIMGGVIGVLFIAVYSPMITIMTNLM